MCNNQHMKKKVIIIDNEEESGFLESLVAGPKKTLIDSWNKVKFVFSAAVLLATFSFSSLGVIFKVVKDGFTIPSIILTIATSMYLVVLLLYWILLKARLNGKDDWALKEAVYNTKYAIRVIKVLVPVLLLFNLIGHPVYDFVVAVFSGISILFGLISFALATSKLIKRIMTKNTRKEKHYKKKSRD